MARVKRGVTSHRRHKRLMQDAEGRKGTKSRLIKPAREAPNSRSEARGVTCLPPSGRLSETT